MTLFVHSSIQQIESTSPDVYAFALTGHIDDDASEALAKFMNDVFDKNDKVNMLMDLSAFSGSDWDSMLDFDVIKSRFRSLSKVDRYAVVGAPERASKMIEFMDNIISVTARAFDLSDIDEAWAFVGARPVTPATA